MSDETFRSKRVFPDQASIQRYLDSSNSPLKNFSDKGQTAAYWIFNAANGNTSSKFGIRPDLNPGVLIAYLEKEQSLISLSNYDTAGDPEKRIRSAMGYGCPDNNVCDSVYYGFANQINWGAYQLEFNFARAGGSNSSEAYRVNRTITTLDGYNVFLSNAATAANYRYTPHAYWGNYNLWKILTANGWGVDSNTYSSDYIDEINIRRIDTPDGVEGEKLTQDDVKNVINRDFKIGQSGGDVILLQRYLRQNGYFTYKYITGYFGNITRTAFDAYLAAGGSTTTTSPNTSTPTPPANTGLNKNSVGISCDDSVKIKWAIGDRYENVRVLQECLRLSNFFTYPVSTGYFGPITQKALSDYFAYSNRAAAAPTPTNNCETLKNSNWQIGQTSEDVKSLQKCMRDAGVFTWPWDTGYFGPVSAEALAKWRGQSAPAFSCGDLKGQAWNFGETSERVRQLQGCMRAAGVFNWPSDTGYFGNVTKASIISWRGYF